MLEKIKTYLSLIKFSHSIFAMPFALIGFFIAIQTLGYFPKWHIFALIILCMVFARNSAMAFNRYTDNKIDKANPRTAMREIPTKKVSPKNALIFTIINSVFFVTASFFINKTVFYLSPLALFIVLSYSYTKRFTFLSHFILGLALSIAPAGAFLAINSYLTIQIIWLSSAVLLWTAGFDILYSLQDEEFDRKNGLFSIPAKYGRQNSLIISNIIHLLAANFIILFSLSLNFNFLVGIGLVIFLFLLVYQHLIVKKDDISKINIAFATTNGVASLVFAVFIIASLYYKA